MTKVLCTPGSDGMKIHTRPISLGLNTFLNVIEIPKTQKHCWPYGQFKQFMSHGLREKLYAISIDLYLIQTVTTVILLHFQENYFK